MQMKQSLENRLKKLQKLMRQNHIGAYLFEDPYDLLYLTGLELSRGMLCVSLSTSCLCVDGRYLQIAQEKSPFPVLDIMDKNIELLIRQKCLEKEEVLYFDPAQTTVQRYHHLKKAFPHLDKKANPLKTLRQIKDDYEIEQLQKSSDILIETMRYIETQFQENMTEKELSYLFEAKALELGADTLSFRPIIAFGKNAAMPHYKTAQTPLKKGQFILIDAGVMKSCYASDMTRVFSFGAIEEKYQRIYDACLKALNAVLHKVKAGVSIKALEDLAQEVVKKEGYPAIPHSLGHGIGLEVHEMPYLKAKNAQETLQENMVVTIEPGIYLPNIAGVRLEEMICVTQTGYKNFYKKYPI